MTAPLVRKGSKSNIQESRPGKRRVGRNTDSSLLADLESFVNRYVKLPAGMSLVVALYAIMTHSFEIFDAVPYLSVPSPTKGCGKTRLLELLSFLCAQALSTVGITPAVLFRVVTKRKPTLLVDESESLVGRTPKAEAIREVANAGYKKGQTIMRCERQSEHSAYGVENFDVFGPKVFALIGSLPATLQDRCIEIKMQRSSERLALYRRVTVEPEARKLAKRIGQRVKKDRSQIKQWYESNELAFLQGRNEELWLPLFAVCSVLAPERCGKLQDIARAVTGSKEETENDVGLRLLSDIHDVIDPEREAIPSAELCDLLNGETELSYHTWNHGVGIQPHDLAKRLRPYGIQPRNVRFAGPADDLLGGQSQVRKAYLRNDFESAWKAYLPGDTPSESSYTATKGMNTGRNEDFDAATEPLRSGTENAVPSTIGAACSAVADSR